MITGVTCVTCKMAKPPSMFTPEPRKLNKCSSRCKRCALDAQVKRRAFNKLHGIVGPRHSQDAAKHVVCSVCGVSKPGSAFLTDARKLNGCRSWCRACANAVRTRDYAERHSSYKARQLRARSRNFAKIMLSRLKLRASRAKLPFDLTLDYLARLIDDTPNCSVFGTPLESGIGAGQVGPNSPSVDRRIPALGYVTGNIAIISWRANRLKGDGTLDELRQLVGWLERTEPTTVGETP